MTIGSFVFGANFEKFPVLEATGQSQGDNAETSHTFTMPADVALGDLLLSFHAFTNGPGTVSLAGWTITQMENVTSDQAALAVLWKFAEAGEVGAATKIITSTASSRWLNKTFRISKAGTPQVSAGANGTANAAPIQNAVNLGAARKALWFVGGTHSRQRIWAGPPLNYSNQLNATHPSEGQDSGNIAVARRAFKAASEDPGDWSMGATVATSARWVTFTVGVPSTGG